MVSKHIIIVAIVAILIAGAVASYVLFTPDPEKVALDAVDKQLKLDKYTTTYNLSYNTKTGGLNLNANGIIVITKNKDITKVSLSLDTFGEKIRLDQYQTSNGIIQCMKSLLNSSCQKVSESSISFRTPQEQSQALKELIGRKVLQLSYAGSKNIVGRTCDGVKSVYDPSKDNPTTQVAGSLQMNLCLDRDTGIPLEMLMNIDLGSGPDGGAIGIDMTLTSLSIDAQEIVVPEYTDNASIPPQLV